MAKSNKSIFDDQERQDYIGEQNQLSKKNKKHNNNVRKKLDEILEKKELGPEDSDDDYLDHYYDFDDK